VLARDSFAVTKMFCFSLLQGRGKSINGALMAQRQKTIAVNLNDKSLSVTKFAKKKHLSAYGILYYFLYVDH
jgi:hypothetical protein